MARRSGTSTGPRAAATPADRRMLMELTAIPTAAGHEERVLAWIDRWVAGRKGLTISRDRVGNTLILQKRRSRGAPLLLFTAHLDHPAFVVRSVEGDRAELEFRGGVHDPYFRGQLELFDAAQRRVTARIESLDSKGAPFKLVRVRLKGRHRVTPGCIGRWKLAAPVVKGGILHTHACDDLAAAAAALAALDRLLDLGKAPDTGILFTVAEEVGFLGAIRSARSSFVPRSARLLCLENSRSFPHDSPIGAGAILRVGDRLSVFTPDLTNDLSRLFGEYAQEDRAFKWQRKLMPGGACEATAFASYGYQSTCLCLPLGNYHNMSDIDGVLAGSRPARVGREFISLSDFESLIRMLVVAAERLPRGKVPSSRAGFRPMMERLYREKGPLVLGAARPVG